YGRSTVVVAASGRAAGAVGVFRSLQPASKAALTSRHDSIRSRYMVTSPCLSRTHVSPELPLLADRHQSVHSVARQPVTRSPPDACERITRVSIRNLGECGLS